MVASSPDGGQAVRTAFDLNQRAVDLYQSDDAATALLLFAEALRLRREALGERHPDTLTSLNGYAVVLDELDRADEAEPLVVEALRLRREVLGERHPDTLNSLNAYAVVMAKFGRADEAEPVYAEALRLRREALGEQHPDTLASLNNHADVLLALGRTDEAAPLFAEALRLFREVRGERHPHTLATLNNYAFVLQALGRANEAEPLFAEELRLSREVLGERHPDTLISLNNYARVLNALRRADEAEPIYAEALRLRREVLGERHPQTLQTLNNYASVILALGRPEEAEPLYAQALRLTREVRGERHPDTLGSLNSYARVLLALGRADEAEAHLAEALRLRRQVLGSRHPATLVNLNTYAQMVLDGGRPADALPLSRELVGASRARAIELAGYGLRGSEQRGRERTTRERTERFHADVLWANFALAQTDRAQLGTEAFTALQLASAGSTTSAVAEAAASRFAARAGLHDLAQERKGLAQRWVALEESLVAAQTGGEDAASQREAIRNDFLAVEARIGEIDARLAMEAPEYFAILNQQATNLDQLRAVLGEGEAVLFLVPTARGTHSMAVTRESVGWSRASMDQEAVSDAVVRLRSGLEVDGSGLLPVFDLDRAHALYAELVAPVEATLQGRARVFVVATGALSRLPLGVLVASPPAEGADFDSADVLRNTAWLADRYALVQLPSLQSLVFIRSFAVESNSEDVEFAGFGAPILEGASRTRGTRSATLGPVEAANLVGTTRAANGAPLMDPAALRRLAALPGSGGELEYVRNALSAPEDALYLAQRMTEPAIRTAELANTRVLHLATHAFTSEESGEIAEPGLVFTPPDDARPDNDGYLAASEVVGLDLSSAEWVILSACNTASPSSQAGASGLTGLAEAFFYAGAQSLLVSHWPVFDDVASVLTVGVLRRERQGMSRAEALQVAMRDIRNDPALNASHPAVWAPFVVAGEGR